VAFARAGVACAAATGAGGGCSMAGYQCLPMLAAPFESTFCVFRSGDVACPGTFQARRRVFYGGVDDDRRCTTCTCDPPSTRECADSMFLSTEPDCSIGQSYDVPVTTCAETGGIVAQYLTYTLEGATGSCPPNPAGGMPAGSCTAETPTTVCCL
jgi:hypothetical protein